MNSFWRFHRDDIGLDLRCRHRSQWHLSLSHLQTLHSPIRMLQWQWIFLNKRRALTTLMVSLRVLFYLSGLIKWQGTLYLLKNKQTALPQTLTPLISEQTSMTAKIYLLRALSRDLVHVGAVLQPRPQNTIPCLQTCRNAFLANTGKRRARSSGRSQKELVREQFDLEASMIGIFDHLRISFWSPGACWGPENASECAGRT